MNATAVMIRGPRQAGDSETAAVPERTQEPAPQHLRALQRANQIRLARAEIKRRVAVGQLSVVDVLLSGAEEIETMEIAELLTSQRRWGHTRARRFLAAIPMTESKTIGSMTQRQLATLASMLTPASPRAPRPLTEQAERVAA
jgi:hypothetical protein